MKGRLSTIPLTLVFQGSWSVRVDFVAANHVHLVEPNWNPMAEAQAVDRVHRIGQTRDVVVTRYIVNDSIETVSYTTPALHAPCSTVI